MGLQRVARSLGHDNAFQELKRKGQAGERSNLEAVGGREIRNSSEDLGYRAENAEDATSGNIQRGQWLGPKEASHQRQRQCCGRSADLFQVHRREWCQHCRAGKEDNTPLRAMG